ncbi:hypothetical protein FB451DRAFT_1358805 [Mycena latifolia]|nr:hypothetical protein FB451DRAFT_1358805 [Mycena latifolia]
MLISAILRAIIGILVPLAPALVQVHLSPAASRSIASWRDSAIQSFRQRYLTPPRPRRHSRSAPPTVFLNGTVTWGVCHNPSYSPISITPARPILRPSPPSTSRLSQLHLHPICAMQSVCLIQPTLAESRVTARSPSGLRAIEVLYAADCSILSASRAPAATVDVGGVPAQATYNGSLAVACMVLVGLAAAVWVWLRPDPNKQVSAAAETPRLVVVNNLAELADALGVNKGRAVVPPPMLNFVIAKDDAILAAALPRRTDITPSPSATFAVTGGAGPTLGSNSPATASLSAARAAITPAIASTPLRLESGERADIVPVIMDPVEYLEAPSPQALPTTPSPQTAPTTPAELVFPPDHTRRKTVPRVWPSTSPCSRALLAPCSPKTASADGPRDPILPLRYEVVIADEPAVSVSSGSSGSALAASATDVSTAHAPLTPSSPFASPSHSPAVRPSPTIASAALLLFPAASPAAAGLPVALAESESSAVGTLTVALSSISVGLPSPSKSSPHADTSSLSEMSVSDLEHLPAAKLEPLPAVKSEVAEAGAEDKDAEAGAEDQDAVCPLWLLGDRGMREGKRHGKPGAASAAEMSFLAHWEGQTVALGRSVAAPKPLAKMEGREAEAEEPEAGELVVEQAVAEAVEEVVEELQVDAATQAEEQEAAAGPSARPCTPASGGEGGGARKAETATRPGSRLHRGPSFIPLASQVNKAAPDVQRQWTTSAVASTAKPQVANGAGSRGAQGQRERTQPASASASKGKPQGQRQRTQSVSESAGEPRSEGVRKENVRPASTAEKRKGKAHEGPPRWH